MSAYPKSILLRSTTVAIWALASGSAWYLGTQWRSTPDKSTLLIALPVPEFQPDLAVVSRFLGAKTTEKTPAIALSLNSRFLLLGVLAENSGAGAALIAVDGKPAKPFRVGSEVINGYTLESVKSRVATLKSSSDNASKVVLEMAPLKK